MNFRIVALVALAFATGAGGVWFVGRTKPVEKQADLTALRTQLDATAEKFLPNPTLEIASVRLKVPEAEREGRIAGIVKMAEDFGGSARQGLDREGAKVLLATVPEERVESFLAAAKKGTAADILPTLENPALVDCEVLVEKE